MSATDLEFLSPPDTMVAPAQLLWRNDNGQVRVESGGGKTIGGKNNYNGIQVRNYKQVMNLDFP